MNYKIYSVCSMNLCAHILPRSYDPFEVNDPVCNDRVDITIRQANKPAKSDMLYKVADISWAEIWKMLSADGDFKWLIKSTNGLGGAVVSSDYSDVEVFFPDILQGIHQGVLEELASPFIRLVLECKMIQRGIISLHSSCVEVGGYGYAFTGPSGVGKSTRSKKWCELFSARWISGDRPAIDTREGSVFGVPWDGKEGVYRSVNCPLAAVLVVKRSKTTSINDLSENDKQQILTQQSFCPLWDVNLVPSYFGSLKRLIRETPIYEICCDNSNDSMYNAYLMVQETIRKRGSAL